MSLTTSQIAALPVHTKDGRAIPKLHPDTATLYLRVSPQGNKTWIQRIMQQGKRIDKGLGSWPDLTITKAREIAQKNRMAVRYDKVPLHTKENAIPTFQECALNTIKEKSMFWKNADTTAQQWLSSLQRHIFSSIGTRKVDELIGRDFYNILMPLWAGKNFDMAEVMRKRCSMIMKWAEGQGYIKSNPVRTITTPDHGQEEKHFRAAHYREVGNILQQVKESHAMKETKALFEFQVLCACRPSEAREATWDSVDLEGALWTIPASKMKMNKEHRIPLSKRALELLHEIAPELPQEAPGLIFSHHGAPLNRSIITSLLKDLDIDSTAHGMRSSFRSWAADNSIPFEVAEEALSHVQNKTIRAYVRTDLLEQRREVMQQWADYVA